MVAISEMVCYKKTLKQLYCYQFDVMMSSMLTTIRDMVRVVFKQIGKNLNFRIIVTYKLPTNIIHSVNLH